MSRAVQSFYGRWAGLYDRLATLPGVRRWRARAADALALAGGETVVDFGCGSGANLPYLRERVGPGGRVVGVDVTGKLLARARDRAARWDNVHVVRGDATGPPLGGGRVDAVLASFVVGMFDAPAAVVADWCALVGPGGRVALLDMSRSRHPVGRALNPAFRAFTAASAPSATATEALASLVPGRGPPVDDALDDRVRAAREALVARTDRRRHASLALGFVGLVAGRVEE